MKKIISSLLFIFTFASITAQTVLDNIYFDIGTEPEASSSMTYGLFQYNWNEDFASNIKFIYSTSTETEDKLQSYVNPIIVTKNKEFELNFHPVVLGFADYYELSLGASYQYIKEEVNAGMFDSTNPNEMMFDADGEDAGKYFMQDSSRKAHIIAPRIGLKAKYPCSDNFVFNIQFYVNPFYFLTLEQSMKYHSNQTVENFNYSGNNSFSKFSTPYVDMKVFADCFQFARIVSQISYQKLKMQQMNWASDGESLKGFDDTQEITKLRFGLELLAGKKQKARVKGGVYYQKEWDKSSYLDSTTKKNKLIISVGSER